MENWQTKTPVIFLIFKRPDVTAQVFEAIRQVKPPKLFIVADGPRSDKPNEAEKCAATRAILDQVDWDCQVFKNYSDVNLGCQKRVSSGLDWAFSQVEEAIILEDDCLPNLSFFRFCEELLEQYRHDSRMMTITGTNYQFGRQRTPYSYYFSRYNHCWGWATWRRAWNFFDLNMKLWPEIRDQGWLKDLLIDIDLETNALQYWTDTFQSTYEGKINSWAFRWTFACWVHSGLTLIPNQNLVSNIGFTADATNMPLADQKFIKKFANMEKKELIFPLKHPPFTIIDVEADSYTQRNNFNQPGFRTRLSKKLNLLLQE